jgi:hypothetical protein
VKRKKLRRDVEAAVLTRSRRRCAVCFGLNRDPSIKIGQIVHLDQDSSNDDPDNLLFLCLEHHDEYDSKTSQSKKLSCSELQHFRDELDKALQSFLTKPVAFDLLEHVSADPVAGRYLRTSGPEESAELQVERIGPARIKVSGLALFGLTRKGGPHTGNLDFETTLEGDVATYQFDNGPSSYFAEIHFTGGGLFIRERYSSGMFGEGASFDGVYRRVA